MCVGSSRWSKPLDDVCAGRCAREALMIADEIDSVPLLWGKAWDTWDVTLSEILPTVPSCPIRVGNTLCPIRSGVLEIVVDKGKVKFRDWSCSGNSIDMSFGKSIDTSFVVEISQCRETMPSLRLPFCVSCSVASICLSGVQRRISL